MDELVRSLLQAMPEVSFRAGKTFCWSPKTKCVSYVPSSTEPSVAIWSLLHEASHALLNHYDYASDFELLQMEVGAWGKAQELARAHQQQISDDHIQHCLDTYRDWLHQRSTCPVCKLLSLQTDSTHYRCFNCQTVWRVTASRFCRPYRLSKGAQTIEKSPELVRPAIFA